MEEAKKLYLKQPNYYLEVTKEYWTIEEAIKNVTIYILKDKKWITKEEYNSDYVDTYNQIENIIRRGINTNLYIKKEFEDDYDSEHGPCKRLNLSASTVETYIFICWAYKVKLPMPDEFRAVLPNYNNQYALSINSESNILSEHNNEIELDEEVLQQIDKADIPWLKKKVKELTNEKNKWDRSIVAAAKIGLLFYEKGLSKPATKPEFIAQYVNEFEGLPKKTVEKIYQALPIEYRSSGGSPAKEPVGVDDDTVDVVIEASAYAGFLTNKEGVEFLDELEGRLTEDEYEIPDITYLKAIQKACKKVMGKYT